MSAEPAAQQPLSRDADPSVVAALRRVARYLNQPMINRLRRCADHDTTADGSWAEVTIYTPEAIQLVQLIDAVDALPDPAARDAQVRAAALLDFAASMRTLADQAPESEPVAWPWTAYALAAVKAEASAGGAGDVEAGVRADERRRVAEEIAQAIGDLNGHRVCAWTRAEAAATARDHAPAPVERVQDAPTDTAGTPDPQRYWWQHDGCDSAPVAGAADWPGRPCTGCGMSLGGWTRGAPIHAECLDKENTE